MSKELFTEMREKQAYAESNPHTESSLKKLQNVSRDISRLLSSEKLGNVSALKVYGIFNDCQKAFEAAKKEVVESAFREADNHPEKQFVAEGFGFEKRAGSTRYSYKGISEWDQKKAELTAIEKKYKTAFINKQNNLTSVTEEGEVLEMPTVTYTSDSLIVKKCV